MGYDGPNFRYCPFCGNILNKVYLDSNEMECSRCLSNFTIDENKLIYDGILIYINSNT